ncbi:FAD-binding oxidoreductase [Nocardia yunnanensis]|uniref:FAD-binding oxidoreductase n=1 Tax=Nocardia yunnanensis TaxID=2382165 RepID=A0A386ZDJ5_9NOCA|nr:FAD-binding oxidoreductase [Nocardia yunnanensis]AYF75437.1 FAD-binding oxidoreductase [Nocardia yunnanensis]
MLEIDTRPAVLDQFTIDETGRAGRRPRGVVYPVDTGEVVTVVDWAREHATPLITRGAGTSLEGHLLARGDELVVDLSRADRILAVTPADFTATAQPGVTRTRLNAAAAEYGLQFTVDPGADASLGGMAAINAFRGTAYAESPALFVDIESGSAAAVAADESEIQRISHAHQAIESATARTHGERHALWEDRHQLYFAVKAANPGCRFLITDTAVPYSRIAGAVDTATRLGTELGLRITVAGHIGDGNVHTIVPYTDAEYPAAQVFSDLVVRHALEVGGTATGEHGIGLTKKKYLREEHGSGVDLMIAVKRALDPLGLFNPGKVLDLAAEV